MKTVVLNKAARTVIQHQQPSARIAVSRATAKTIETHRPKQPRTPLK